MKKCLCVFLLLLAVESQAQWTPFGPVGATDNTVVDFEYYNNELYATGLFSTINGVSAKTVAKWTGSTWVQSGSFTDWGHSLRSIDTVLFLAKYRANNDSNYLWYFNGSTWNTLGQAFRLVGAAQGLKPDLYDVIQYNNELYVCGEFNRCGTDTISGIARWNGSQWVSCGQGLSLAIAGGPPNMYPHQMHVFNNQLYVVGNFRLAGGLTCNGIAAWDGNTWSPLGTGFNKTAYAVTSYQGELYAGGEFTTAGTSAVGSIAQWNGSQWVQPGFQFYTMNALSGNFCFVHTMENLYGQLYIAGGFNRVVTASSNTLSCGSIVAYDGSNLALLDGGADSDVEGLIAYQQGIASDVLVGGIFHSVSTPTVSCNNMAIYHPSTSVGIDDVSTEQTQLLYPNPAQDKLFISSDQKMEHIEFYSISGELLLQQDLSGTQPGIDISTLPAGYYLVRLQRPNGAMYQRLLKY